MLEFTGVGVHLKVRDIKVSRDFYEKLGFTPVFGYGSEEYRATLPEGCASAPERYQGVTYKLTDGAEFEIADGHIASKPDVFEEKIFSGKVSAMIRVKSIVPVIEAYKEKIVFPVRKYYWGSIEVALRDPDGFVLVFIAPFSDGEYAEVANLINIETIEP